MVGSLMLWLASELCRSPGYEVKVGVIVWCMVLQGCEGPDTVPRTSQGHLPEIGPVRLHNRLAR